MRLSRAGRRLALFTSIIVTSLLAASCANEDPRLESMVNLEPTPPSRERIDELQEVVDRYGEIVGEKIDAAYQQADALKLLAQEYIRQQLYGPAMEALEEAILIDPRNHILHYLTGVTAGFLGKSQTREDRRVRYL